MGSKPETIDEYLGGVSEDKRVALNRIRLAIKQQVPAAEECISYGIPGFRLNGKQFFSFGAAKNHCAVYGSIPEEFADELKGYDTDKGTIRFQPDNPLPADLLRKLIKHRVEKYVTSYKKKEAQA